MKNKKIDITYFEVSNKKIPKEFDGYKIAHITDLHNAMFGEGNYGILDALNKINPDIVVLTGDLIIGDGEDFRENLSLLRGISEKYKTYSVYGNHEQEAINGEHAQYYKGYFEELSSLNINEVHNNSIEIRESSDMINIYGLVIPLEYYPHGSQCMKRIVSTIEPEMIEGTLGKLKEEEFNIVLAHNPLFFNDYTRYNADLVFSGHIHGGMIRIPGVGGLLSPTRRFFPKYDWGKYDMNGTTMILSRGLGGAGFVPRILCRPEIICVKLNSL